MSTFTAIHLYFIIPCSSVSSPSVSLADWSPSIIFSVMSICLLPTYLDRTKEALGPSFCHTAAAIVHTRERETNDKLCQIDSWKNENNKQIRTGFLTCGTVWDSILTSNTYFNRFNVTSARCDFVTLATFEMCVLIWLFDGRQARCLLWKSKFVSWSKLCFLKST